jgi:hypothetical protein
MGAPSVPIGPWPALPDRREARVVAQMEEDAPAQRTVLLQHSPAAATGRIALIVALPGELHTRPPVPLHLAAVQHGGDDATPGRCGGADADVPGGRQARTVRSGSDLARPQRLVPGILAPGWHLSWPRAQRRSGERG